MIINRIMITALTLFAAALLVFWITEIVPGDPAAYMMGLNADPDALAALRTQFGFDQPVWQRFARWITGMLQGDFGISYTYRIPVIELVAERFLVSLPLAIYALLLTLMIGIPAGLISAFRVRRWPDQVLMTLSQLGLAVPNFWLAILLVSVFSIGFGWFSAGGFPGWAYGPFVGIKALTLPAIALALPQAAILTRIMRTSLIETMSADYVRTARAKGLSRWQVLTGHQFRNALLPVLTIIGLQFSFLIAGGVIIEKVFFLPGLGQLILEAVAQRDLITVRAIVMILIVMVIAVALLIDIAYRIVDPRIGTSREGH